MKHILAAAIIALALTTSFWAQTTAFTYQGKLTNAGTAASGAFDFTFKLFAAATGGAQIGGDVLRDDAAVNAGVFTVTLDFGSSPFTSSTANYLEIWVRPGAQTGGYTQLLPRSPITSSPYAVQTLHATSAATADNANQLGGVNADQFVQTTDGRLSDARTPTAESPYYIQNIPGIGQQNASFNINGSGSANIFNATTQYNIGADRVLSVTGQNNFFAGVGAGQNNTGTENSFVGKDAGLSNTSGQSNTFFGYRAGGSNITAGFNAFFGKSAGFANTNGSENAFFGHDTGLNNSIGSSNAFFGRSAGAGNISGNGNVFIGYNANPTSTSLTNATAIGASAAVSQSNSLVLGSIGGVNGAALSTNVGIGTTAPQHKLHVVGENVRVEGNTPGTLPRFSMNFTGGLPNEKKWQNYAAANRLSFTALGDAEGFETFWMQVNRGPGTSISSVTFPNGNVGIGTNGPGANLHVVGNTASTGNNTAIFENSSIGPNISHLHFGPSGDWFIRSAASGGKVVLQDTGGNVGIGTSAPAFKLQVVDPSNTGLRVQTGTPGGTVASFGGNGAFQIDAAGVSGGRLSVAESGNVGIGTNAPGKKLQVHGNVYLSRQGFGLILRSGSGGLCWEITVNDSGQLGSFSVPCP